MLLRIIRKVPKKYHKVINFSYKVWGNFSGSNGLSRCSSLAYTLLFAFIPFSISIVSISAWLPVSEEITNNIEYYFFSQYIPQLGHQVYDLFKFSFSHTKRLSIFGFISLFVTSYGMMFSIEQHIHDMWHLKRQRKLIYSFIVFSGFFVVGTIFIFVMAYFTEFVQVRVTHGIVYENMGRVSAHIVTIVSFISIYKFIPSVKVKWLHAIIAGIGAAIAFIILQLGFTASMDYLQKDYELLYGSLAMLPIFLLWLYLSVLILLLGAQVIYVLRTSPAKRKILGSVLQ
ncbi:MAG: YihY family inner membrane protein [Neisseriaceae bacterium]|nr:MAG: YihY family inner membrane protein [Neisseriaceae bacterium]